MICHKIRTWDGTAWEQVDETWMQGGDWNGVGEEGREEKKKRRED